MSELRKTRKIKEPKMIKATYRECTETARRLIRPCFKCEFKHTEECKHCPPLRVRLAIIECICIGYRILEKYGYVILPNSYDEMDEKDLIFERKY